MSRKQCHVDRTCMGEEIPTGAHTCAAGAAISKYFKYTEYIYIYICPGNNVMLIVHAASNKSFVHAHTMIPHTDDRHHTHSTNQV